MARRSKIIKISDFISDTPMKLDLTGKRLIKMRLEMQQLPNFAALEYQSFCLIDCKDLPTLDNDNYPNLGSVFWVFDHDHTVYQMKNEANLNYQILNNAWIYPTISAAFKGSLIIDYEE